jgi:glyceraldehyde 3-phosphate dehydrogenase
MKTKIAINGFGRIGRNAFKIAFQRGDLEVVAVNDLTDTKTLAHLLKHDSNYGTYQNEVDFDEENLIVSGQKIKVLAEKDPAALPWKDLDVEIVIESTGFFVDPAKAKAHLDAGAKKVILSAPAKGEGATTIVLGVNEDKLSQAEDIISNASCTTNCITPVMAILENEFGIEKAMMTTVHSYTASQRLQDAPAKDLREARNAASNIVPTTTGASIAAAKALPALEGIFGGMSVRVPTPVVSLSDFAVVTKKDVTVDEVNAVFKKAAKEPFFQGILDVTEEELVSTDFIGNSHSAIVDLKLTAVIGGNLLKVVAWYDNEWGYSNRLVELTADVAKVLHGGKISADSRADSDDASKAEEKPMAEATKTSGEKEPETAEPLGVSSENSQEHQSPEELLKGPQDPLLEAPDLDAEQKTEPDPAQHESLEQAPPEVKTAEKPYIISMPGSAEQPNGDQPGSPELPESTRRF